MLQNSTKLLLVFYTLETTCVNRRDHLITGKSAVRLLVTTARKDLLFEYQHTILGFNCGFKYRNNPLFSEQATKKHYGCTMVRTQQWYPTRHPITSVREATKRFNAMVIPRDLKHPSILASKLIVDIRGMVNNQIFPLYKCFYYTFVLFRYNSVPL